MLTIEEIQTQAGALLQPIPGPDPGGQNASLDPRYEQLRATMAGLDSPSGGEVEWPPVVASGETLLREASKDLLIAGYLGHARLKTAGLDGLAVGLETMIGLLDNYWDTMFPPLARLRGRGNALDWFVARLEPELPRISVAPTDRPTVEIIASQSQRLGALSREKLGEFCPSMRGVDEALQRILLSLPAPVPSAAPPTAAEGTPVPPAPVEAAGGPPPPPASQGEPAQPAEAPAPSQPENPASLTDEIRSRVADLLAPISADAPTGADARFETAYESAKLEVSKLGSLTADAPPDWKTVIDGTTQILRGNAKDLLMAAYHAFACYQERGLSHLPQGLMLIEGLVDAYGDALFPSRPRGRGNALSWLVDALEFPLGEEKLKPDDRKLVLELDAAVGAFSAITRDKMEDHAPTTRGLSERVQRMLMAVPEKKPVAPPPPPRPSAPKPAAPIAPTAAMPAVAGTVADSADVTKFLRDTGKSLVSAGDLLRREQLTDPTAYRLVRVGLWMHLAASPPADAGGQTGIPPLPDARRTQFETLAANAKYIGLVEETESALSQFRFNLDLNRMTWNALDQLGEPYVEAKKSVAAEVGTLLARMPTLPELSASDGSPLADADTRKWLGETVLAGAGAAPSGGGGVTDDDGALMAEIRGAMKTKPVDAMKAATAAIHGAPTARARFVRQVGVAEICLEASKPILARGMFAGLEREMRERGLMEWDQALASRCLEGFVRSIRAATKLGNNYAAADDVFERLCLVDPQAAARLST